MNIYEKEKAGGKKKQNFAALVRARENDSVSKLVWGRKVSAERARARARGAAASAG